MHGISLLSKYWKILKLSLEYFYEIYSLIKGKSIFSYLKSKYGRSFGIFGMEQYHFLNITFYKR
jgi:hypothetical protein